MISINRKKETYRVAVAQSTVVAKSSTFDRMLNNDVPKKDILPLARASGVMAAKKTWELIPYCHPITLDSVEIEFKLEKINSEDSKLTVLATVETIGKTGVEMEALSASSVSSLTIYDMLKPIDKNILIENTHLVSKKGGKTQFKEKVPKNFKAAIVVTSDGTYEGTREDKSGKIIKNRLEDFNIPCEYIVLPDEILDITRTLSSLIEDGFPLIVTTGGTGLGPRDVTVEATKQVVDREIPGIMEAARDFGQKRTPYAMLSRGIVGQKNSSLIVNLPGSSRGVEESLDAIFPHILHSYGMMRGGGHPEAKTLFEKKEVVV